MNYPAATFTMTHLEFRTIDKAWYDKLFDSFSDDADVKATMYEVFNAMWDVYEISGETIGEQEMFLEGIYKMHYRYYKEVLTNYMKEWDYSTGGRKITDYSKSGSNNSEGISVDLPNKKIDADIYAYPNNGDKTKSESSSSGQTVVTDTSAFIQLKRDYLDQIRNVFEEFAGRFDNCFLMLY